MPNALNLMIARGVGDKPTWDLFDAQKNALAVEKARMENQAYPEDRNWLRQARGMAVEKHQEEMDKWAQEKEMRPLKTDEERVKYLFSIGPMLNFQNYAESRKHLVDVNKFPDQYLPPVESFQDENAFETWKESTLTTLGERLKKQELGLKTAELGIRATSPEMKKYQDYTRVITGTKTRLKDALGQAGISVSEQDLDQMINKPMIDKMFGLTEKAGAESPLGKLLSEYNALAKDDPNRDFYRQRIAKEIQATGETIRVNKDGSIEIIRGPLEGGAGEFTTKIKTDIQTKLFNANEQLARLDLIERDFKPEYQQTGERFKAAWTGIKAKLGQNVSSQDAKSLTEFSQYKRKAIENINLYIKEVTGAQMSEQEADRLRQAQPDPGDSWYNGDDPISFKAKLDDVMATTRMSIARYHWYLKKGFTDDQIKEQINSNRAVSLDSMKNVIRRRGQEIEKRLSEQGVSGINLGAGVVSQLQEEFGLSK